MSYCRIKMGSRSALKPNHNFLLIWFPDAGGQLLCGDLIGLVFVVLFRISLLLRRVVHDDKDVLPPVGLLEALQRRSQVDHVPLLARLVVVHHLQDLVVGVATLSLLGVIILFIFVEVGYDGFLGGNSIGGLSKRLFWAILLAIIR